MNKTPWLWAFGMLWLAIDAMGQTRIISHVTRPDGGFETAIILENRAATAGEYTLTAYDADGVALAPARGQLPAQTAASFPADELFPGERAASHILVEGVDIHALAAYRSVSATGSPAHVGESAVQSARFRLYPGDWTRVFDGFAAVNMGGSAADVRVAQFTLDGAELRTVNAIPALNPMAKGLFVIGGPQTGEFEARADVYYEVFANQPLALTALRGTLPGSDYLWANQAAPVVPALGKAINDRPEAASGDCVDPTLLGPESDDLNNMPQAEVWIDVADDGRLAAVAKDYRFSPLDDVTYNVRVWGGLYLSEDQGGSWRNTVFDGGDPNRPLETVNQGHFGQQPGATIRFEQESDPVALFDRDGNLYTTGLAFTSTFDPNDNPLEDPSAITVARWNNQGEFEPETLHFIGAENDARLFNDKNWIAVDRDAPVESTVVAVAWRLFTAGGPDDPAPGGGYVAVSADGSASFSEPIRMPLPEQAHAAGAFFQPLIGSDPVSGAKTLYVLFRTANPADFSMQMNVLKCGLDSLPAGDTAALSAHLRDSGNWTYLPDRLAQLFLYGSGGWGGAFRFNSIIMPAIDRETGWLYAVVAAFDPVTMGSRTVIARSTDGGLTWSQPIEIDYPGQGHQIQPAVAVHGGRVSVLWYDSRHDPNFMPFSLIPLLDVYYAELDADLNLLRLERLTPESMSTDQPVFIREQPGAKRRADPAKLYPHDMDYNAVVMASLGRPRPAGGKMDDCSVYGFIGDYIGIAADGDFAYLAWCDLRDMDKDQSACGGHDCNGRRNQNVYFARIRKTP